MASPALALSSLRSRRPHGLEHYLLPSPNNREKELMAKADLSIAEALSRAHQALRNDLQKLEESIHRTSDQDIPAIRAHLGATRAHILEHFRFEERDGYMDRVRKREPRLQHAIDQLAGEHRQLAQSLDALIENAK